MSSTPPNTSRSDTTEHTVALPQQPTSPPSTSNDVSASTSEFTSGCVGGLCARPAKKIKTTEGTLTTNPPTTRIQPWHVPDSARQEIEEQLLPVLPDDAHCGSVEFLYSAGEEEDNHGKERRLYFDLNLLSTLPLITTDPTSSTTTTDDDHGRDPWMELATSIWDFVHC